MGGPLDGLFVLDFSNMVPGPYATLMLGEAGAEVLKVERPETGEDLRQHGPSWQGESVAFAMLNYGKKSIELDLKSPECLDVLSPLISRADILVEQFRPGVMERLGLGYDALSKINPSLIYCSITGYGQNGPMSKAAGHDLNFLASSGVLSVSSGPAHQPTVPPGLIGDIGGGSYPAVVNILLALIERQKTGRGLHLDIAMSEGIFPFAFWAYGRGAGLGQEVGNGADILTGATPRYRLYPACDGRLIAVAAIEQKFWDAFCSAIELDAALRNDQKDMKATIAGVGEILAQKSADEWRPIFAAADCCCSIVSSMDEVRSDPHFTERGIFKYEMPRNGEAALAAMPLPIAPEFRENSDQPRRVPPLGGDNAEIKRRG